MLNTETFNCNSLPLGNPDFNDIRDTKMIYVDKTSLVAEIAKQRSPIFFSRPRRFGKSLLVHTLHSLFESGLKYFNGLDIEKKWTEKTYKVVRLDFSRLANKNSQKLERSLNEALVKKFNLDNTISLKNELGMRSPDDILSEICESIPNNSTVLLIDEYDAPLTHHIEEVDELKSITGTLNDFYATIKEYTGKFRFIFITGIARVCHLSIFSAFNNLTDLSLDDEFNTLLGFTKNDLERYFDNYIEYAAKILKTTKGDVYKNLEYYYDGFQFSLNSNETVYNPWSILNFCKNPKNAYYNYWFESGGTPSIIMNYLKVSSSFDFLDYDKREILVNKYDLTNKYELHNIPLNILLYQTGYYSIRTIDIGIALLVIANKEVEESLYRIYLLANNLEPKDELKRKMLKLQHAIDNKKLEEIVDIFNSILNECVSSSSTIFKDERSIRDIIYAALTNIPSLQKRKEHDTAKGRSDLEILTKKTCLTIEFKRTYTNRSPKIALKLAEEQIKNRKYGVSFSGNCELYCVVMVISTEEKCILLDYCKEITISQ